MGRQSRQKRRSAPAPAVAPTRGSERGKSELLEEVDSLQKTLREQTAAAALEREPPHMERLVERQRRELRRGAADLLLEHKSLEDARDRYADLYDFAPIGYITLEPNGLMEEVNQTAAHMLGLVRARLLGTPLLVYVTPSDRIKFLAHMRRCRSGAVPAMCEVTLRQRDKSPVPVQIYSTIAEGRRVSAVPLDGPRFRTVLIDLTERRQYEAEVARYQDRLQSMATELSMAEERERRRIATRAARQPRAAPGLGAHQARGDAEAVGGGRCPRSGQDRGSTGTRQ